MANDGHQLTLRVRYYASARAAAGTESEDLTVPAGTTVAELIERLAAEHPEKLPKVLAAASYLVDGFAVRDTSAVLADGAEFDVLPPFAGG